MAGGAAAKKWGTMRQRSPLEGTGASRKEMLLNRAALVHREFQSHEYHSGCSVWGLVSNRFLPRHPLG
jgi:hypothetical protein